MNNVLPRDPHIVALRFEAEQLSRARELKGLTKTTLAELVSKTPSAITQFESGTIQPDAETVARLSLALGVPTSFFVRKSLVSRLALDECHFRSLRSVSQYLRRQTLRVGEIVHEILILLEDEGIELPQEQVSPLKLSVYTVEDIEHLALNVRRFWGLGNGPIPNVIRLLESKGINVLPLANSYEDVDAFSMWYEGRPFIMLAMHKSASRTHFDAAHELGHLIMHEDVQPADPPTEKEANAFASAFLLPRDTFLSECPSRWSLPVFRALKRRWHVSIRALVYRAHQLGCLSPASYRRANIEMNRLYGSKNEPDEWPLERPQVLREALALVQDDLPFDRLADLLALHRPHLEEILRPIMANE